MRKNKGTSACFAVLCFFTALFLVMLGYFVWYVGGQERKLFYNSYNSARQILLTQNKRGAILAADGEILAQSVILPNGAEQRLYPYGAEFAHVIGFSTKGCTGVEALADYELCQSSVPIFQRAANSAGGSKNPGDNVYTTLQVFLQEAAYRAMEPYEGALIVTETATGKILAMVSKPDFDPNEIPNIWGMLVQQTDSSVLLNRVTKGLYPPGSTFKLVTALACIRQNPDTWQRASFFCDGQWEKEEYRVSCYHGIAHGRLDLRAAFAESCNGAFSAAALSLNRKQFSEMLKSLLFQQSLPISLPHSVSRIDLSEDLTEEALMQLAIGQGTTLMTPIHLHMLTAAVANKGLLLQPYLIDRIENAAGGLVSAFSAEEGILFMSQEEAAILSSFMTAAVEEGTAAGLSGRGYTAAGKTGSAEYSETKEESHAWFTGFAPAENPKICITVVLEGAGSGGAYAVPVAAQVLDAYFAREKNP